MNVIVKLHIIIISLFVCLCLCPEKDQCKKCNADKVIRDRKVLEVHVDKGMKDGHKFYFRGDSNQVCVCV